jgi:hypothetical protein
MTAMLTMPADRATLEGRTGCESGDEAGFVEETGSVGDGGGDSWPVLLISG